MHFYKEEYLSLIRDFITYSQSYVKPTSTQSIPALSSSPLFQVKATLLPKATAAPPKKNTASSSAIVKKEPILQKSALGPHSNFPFLLEPPVLPPITIDLQFQKQLKKALPHISFHYSSQQTAKAKQAFPKIQKTIPEVAIFFYKELSSYQSLLEKISFAINKQFSLSSSLLDITSIASQNLWESLFAMSPLRCIIASDSVLFSFPNLKNWHSIIPDENKQFLGKVPLIFFSNLSSYSKDPYYKRSLWNNLCQILKLPAHPILK